MDGIAIFSAFLQGLGVVAFAVRLNELAVTQCTSPRWESVATASTFMVGAAVSMVFPLTFAPGVVFDLRHVFLVLAAPFGGWPAALLTAAATSGVRILQGGVGLYAGLVGIAISTAVGFAFAYGRKRRQYSLTEQAAIGLAASLSMTSIFLLPLPIALEVLERIAVPFALINLVGVMISADSLNRVRQRMSRERTLVRDTATDPLTGLSNRRVFDAKGPELAAAEMSRKGRYAIMVVDIDRFKSINDTFGHANGDMVLKQISTIVAACARDSDLVVRYGGEEIALVLPGCDEKGTAMIADRIRTGIENSVIELGGIKLKITASVGYTVVDNPGLGFWAAFEEADQALYRAKTGGRNRVEKAQVDLPKFTARPRKSA
mgnify:CR=1 FL=1